MSWVVSITIYVNGEGGYSQFRSGEHDNFLFPLCMKEWLNKNEIFNIFIKHAEKCESKV